MVRQHKCSQICSVAVRDLQGFAPTGNFTECLGTWIRGTWVLCSTAEQGQEASQRTVTLLGALIDQQHREKDGGAVLSSFGSKYESFCYQTVFRRGGGLLSIAYPVVGEKSNCRCSGFQFQQIFSPAFSKPCTVRCWIQIQSVVHRCPAYCLTNSSGKERNILPVGTWSLPIAGLFVEESP